MAERDNEPDPMQQPWCCLTCSQTFRWGKVRMRAHGLHCPHCDSTNLHPADGTTTELDSYGGEVGTLN